MPVRSCCYLILYSLLSVPQITKDTLQGICVSGRAMRAMYRKLSDAYWGENVCDEYAWHEEGLGRGNFPIDRLPGPEEAAERFGNLGRPARV